jgi:hypothetical protein
MKPFSNIQVWICLEHVFLLRLTSTITIIAHVYRESKVVYRELITMVLLGNADCMYGVFITLLGI